MFAGDYNRKGVFGSWTASATVHILILLLILSWNAKQRQKILEGYTLTEITVIQEVPDEQKPVPIQKPKNVMDILKNVIPIKQKPQIELAQPKALELDKPKIELNKPKALDMSKMDSSIKPATKAIDLSNEVGREKISPMMAKQQIALQQKQSIANQPAKIDMSKAGKSSSFLPQKAPALSMAGGTKKPVVSTTAPKLDKPTPAAQKQVQDQSLTIEKKSALMITGQIAGRQIINTVKPAYPNYLQAQGTQGEVTIFFYVKQDGTVKENARIENSSGYTELDQNALEALLQFRFAPIDASEDQSGYATFRYMLEK